MVGKDQLECSTERSRREGGTVIGWVQTETLILRGAREKETSVCSRGSEAMHPFNSIPATPALSDNN